MFQIHPWVKQVLDQAEGAFRGSPGKRRAEPARERRRIEQLEAKRVHKNEVEWP